MGNPYLNSGETIVLTTNRVSVDAVPYDMMLTTERIFFIDNRNDRFEPRIIPLSTILSVQGGKTAALDPVITLLFRSGGEQETRKPVNIVFSQHPNENRKPERDDWVRNLIQMSISQRERDAVPEPAITPEPAETGGLRPKARHGVAPEKVRPLSNIMDSMTSPPPVTIIPEEVEGAGEIPASAAAATPIKEKRPVPESPARVVIPQIIEEMLPDDVIPPLPEKQEPAPVVGFDPKVLFRSVPTAAPRSATVTEEQPLSQQPEATGPAQPPAPGAEPDAAGTKEVPEIIRALSAGTGEPEPPEQPAFPHPETIPETLSGSPDDENHGEVEPEAIRPEPEVPEEILTVPEPEIPEPPAPEAAVSPGPPTAEVPPVRHPLPPAREIRPPGTAITYVAVLILIIGLVAAAAILLSLPGPGTGNPVSPAPAITETGTQLPKTTQTTTVPPPVTQPVTPTATPVSTPAAPAIPQEGVWIRVTSTSGYFGSLGNAELMRQVSGTGDNLYQPLWSDRPVQVSVQKKDNSGAMLTVTIYKNGTPISTRSITSPMGSVNLLIDPRTGRAPGLTVNDTLPDYETMPTVLENY